MAKKKVEVVMNRTDHAVGQVVETFEDIDVIEVSSNDKSLELRKVLATGGGAAATVFHAQPSAWLCYRVI
jgi:hypothetical protein